MQFVQVQDAISIYERYNFTIGKKGSGLLNTASRSCSAEIVVFMVLNKIVQI